MPNPAARAATSEPTRPSPTEPDRLAGELDALPVRALPPPVDQRGVRLGDIARLCQSNARVCSAAEMMLDCGALTTITPRRVASSTSTLSSPIPARATTCSVVAAAEHVGGHLGGASDDEGVVGTDLGRRASRRELGPHVDLEVLRQQIKPLFGQGLGDQHPHGQSRLLEHLLRRGDRRAELDRIPEPLQRHLQRREPADDVELADVPEVPDPEDRRPSAGPCPGASTQPKSARIRSQIASALMPSGARIAVTVQLSSRPSPNRSRPIARTPSLTARLSISCRARAASTPSWK